VSKWFWWSKKRIHDEQAQGGKRRKSTRGRAGRPSDKDGKRLSGRKSTQEGGGRRNFENKSRRGALHDKKRRNRSAASWGAGKKKKLKGFAPWLLSKKTKLRGKKVKSLNSKRGEFQRGEMTTNTITGKRKKKNTGNPRLS